MDAKSNSTGEPRQSRPSGKEIDAFVGRVFGFEEGAIFDRRKVPPGLLDEFMSSQNVRRATEKFALEMLKLWKTQYPGKALLCLAITQPTPCESPVASNACPVAAPTPTPKDPEPAPIPAPAMPHNPCIEPAAGPPSAKVGAIPPPTRPVPVSTPERTATFTLPNAKSGEAYDFVIQGKDDLGRTVSVLQARVVTLPGLIFDPATARLRGVPAQAGDHAVSVQWQVGGGERRSGSLVLIVNPNPRDLWKCIDPDTDDPYFKPNEESRDLQSSSRRIAAGSKRGRSHAHAGTCRDDDFYVAHDAASGWSVLVVADGAGSAKSSRKGAQLAACQAGQYLSTALGGEDGAALATAEADWEAASTAGARRLKEDLYKLFGRAARAGLQAIEEEAAARSAPVKDYATTLLCALHRKAVQGEFVASFWLGDGAICAYGPAGQATLMGKPDSGEFAGQTRFLDKAAVNDSTTLWNRIEFGRHDLLTALILMTDGISDPRFETDNGLAATARWDALWDEVAPALATPEPGRALVDWMDFFTPGHHDDRTIALLW